ncbi:uncharacterized protein LOC108739903 isoform X2 [Agrilus planipennis]|uniref:Uncharacterized protein LOC108739903 isoform X2 n=1 Tax=Agrilus planipennis TaxID=224129 RepID=A0A1W4X086_AGRPL|nr:uncharacterized protein LOC108739903 isoform X2 [Agrilus planipennis]
MDENQITKRARRSPLNLSPSLIITREYITNNSKSDSEDTAETSKLDEKNNSRLQTNVVDITISSSDDSRFDGKDVSFTLISDSPEKSGTCTDGHQKVATRENQKDEFNWVAPQFKDLSVGTLIKERCVYQEDIKENKESKSTAGNKSQVKLVRMYIEALCSKTGQIGELLSLDCHVLRENDVVSESDSSGYAADVSKTVSPLSGASATYIPPPKGSLAMRASLMSHSSSSSVPSSAAALNVQNLLKKSTSSYNKTKEPVSDLEKKWKNYQLVYSVLSAIDDSFVESSTNVEKMDLTESSNHIPQNSQPAHVPPKKRGSFVIQGKDEKEPEIKKIRPNTFEEESMLVFAKWTDQRYYAGFIKGQSENKWTVEFLDGNFRNVSDEQIIFADVHSLIGYKVMVLEESGNVKCPGIVTAFHSEEEPMYTVATDRGDFTVSASNIYLTKHQAKLVKNNIEYLENSTASSSSQTSSVSLRNCRSRNNTYSPKPGSSGTQKTLLAKAFEMKMHAKSASELSTTTDEDVSENTSNGELKLVPGCDMELRYQRVNNPSIKLKRCFGQLSKSSSEKEVSTLGPLDVKGTWFKGFGFLLTCGSRPLFDATGEEDVGTDNEDYAFSKVPYVEDHLATQIKNGGGIIYSKFEDVPPKKYKVTYLVSWRPALTPKYIRGLAVGMRTVCHEWIVNCSIKKKRLTLQELPAGWSVEDHRFIESFERKTDKPFRSLHFKIAQLTSKLFYDFWSKELWCLSLKDSVTVRT